MITRVLDIDIAADTMGGLLDRRVDASPDLVFARCGDESVTYRELDAMVVQVQRALAAERLEPGARVAMLAHNSLWHLAVMFACARSGVLWCPLNVSLGSDDLAYTIGDVAPDLVIADAALVESLGAAVLGEEKVPVVVIGAEAGADGGIEQWVAAAAAQVPLASEVGAGDAFCIMYSGGTTGRPKGVILPHFAAVSCGYRLGQVATWSDEEVFYSTSHLFHAYLPCAIVPFAMAKGFLVCFDEWFSASQFWDRVRACGATVIDPFIGMAGALVAQPDGPGDLDHGVRLAISGFGGADPNAIAIRRRFEQRFGIPTYQPYGQTEAGGFITVETAQDERRFGSSGKLTGWYDAVIVDDDGMPQGAGAEGELWVRPRFPHVMAHGYLNRAEDTLLNWRNLWVHTGDRCSFDADGYLWFIGRGGHFLRRRGELVSIGEVEMVLSEHPAVREVAVVAVPSSMGEDDARCSVVLEAGATLAPEELVAWALERLAPFKVPRYVELIDELPRTATKAEIDRGALAAAGTAGCHDREAVRS
ncbi:MAG: putative O-succinylbenzoate-CoA ligase [Actinomycetia bacterium]|nr:putative O-succinylbenzoate-CoA ligase [Actinomycetes bacterium]